MTSLSRVGAVLTLAALLAACSATAQPDRRGLTDGQIGAASAKPVASAKIKATPKPTKKPKATPRPTPRPTRKTSSCHPSYSPCLPIVGDLNCPDVRDMGMAPVTVKGPDDYELDRDNDGIGCE
jgi:hypothetical protein